MVVCCKQSLVVVFFVLVAINQCLAKPKWIWQPDEIADDGIAKSGVEQRGAKKRYPTRKDCSKSRRYNCRSG